MAFGRNDNRSMLEKRISRLLRFWKGRAGRELSSIEQVKIAGQALKRQERYDARQMRRLIGQEQ